MASSCSSFLLFFFLVVFLSLSDSDSLSLCHNHCTARTRTVYKNVNENDVPLGGNITTVLIVVFVLSPKSSLQTQHQSKHRVLLHTGHQNTRNVRGHTNNSLHF